VCSVHKRVVNGFDAFGKHLWSTMRRLTVDLAQLKIM